MVSLITAEQEGGNDLSCLGGQASALRTYVTTVNTCGSLDGLLAAYVLGHRPGICWHVNPLTDSWLQEHVHRTHEASVLAAIGYGLAMNAAETTADLGKLICGGLQRFMKRDPFPGDRVSFLQDIRILIGVHLVVAAVATDFREAPTWLIETLADPRLKAADLLHELAQAHVRAAIGRTPVEFTNIPDAATGSELAMMLWMTDRGTGRLNEFQVDTQSFRRQAVRAVLVANPADLTISQAALLLRVAYEVIDASVKRVAARIGNGPPASEAKSFTASAKRGLAAAHEFGQAKRPLSGGGAGHAFLSYVREDSHSVDGLQQALEAAGIEVWRDVKDLWPGQDWRNRVRQAITRDAIAFIVCFSQGSVDKYRSHQNDEVLLAIDELRVRNPQTPWFFQCGLTIVKFRKLT